MGFGFSGPEEALTLLREIGQILEPIGAGDITFGGGAPDLTPMVSRGMPGLGLMVQPDRYMWYHHTEADTLDKLDPDEMARCVAAMAVMAFVAADLPGPLWN